MNCIEKDNFINSRFDNNTTTTSTNELVQQYYDNNIISSEPVTPRHQESLHSFRFSSSGNSSSEEDLELALSYKQVDYKEWNNQHSSSMKKLSMVSQQQQQINNKQEGELDSSNSSDKSTSNPVTPDDREPFIPPLMKRSTSSRTRHRTSFKTTSLYPSTSSQMSNKISAASTATRYLPQNQAVITTQDNWRISLSNHIATGIFGLDLTGKHILDFIDVSHRPLLLDRVVKTRESQPSVTSNGGSVLICGDIIPIIKQDGTKSSASLWLKEKKSSNDNGSFIFIWIFEEVFSSAIEIELTNDSIISAVDGDVYELFGYTRTELLQRPITTLIPSYNSSNKFGGARTKLNTNFPVMNKQVNANSIRVISMPTLAGLVTIKNGMITSCNAAFSKYLFGCSVIDNPVSSFIPQFNKLISFLQRDDLLQQGGRIVNKFVCSKVLGNNNLSAMHRDGTLFDIDLQIKWLGKKDYALWVTFDRDAVFSKYGHHHTSTRQQQLLFLDKDAATSNTIQRSKSINIPPSVKKKKSMPSFMMMTNSIKEPTVATTKITSFSRPSTFTSAKSAIEATKQQMINSNWPIGEYSAQTLKTSIADYEIADELGQGAYGLVKLAYLRNDPEMKRVVIKYVIKSRILVDCWTRDRKLGLIPAEIHVLHTLRKIPHINCSDMLDYFEDDDYYYVVMDLYGAGMDLFDYIELKHGGMKEDEIRSIFKQVVAAVRHLHDHRIVHRDIKDENVILDLKGGVRLIDFGSAAYVKDGKKYETFVGTLDYAAPEVLKGQAYTGPPQDVWACGTLLYTLIYRENPFYNIDEIMEHELRIPFILSEETVDLISKMLDRNVETRLNIHQVLEHPWFQLK